MTHTYCAFGKCSTCSMLHSLHKCEISSKFSNLLHFTNKITHLRIHRTENAMRNYYNYAFSRTTWVFKVVSFSFSQDTFFGTRSQNDCSLVEALIEYTKCMYLPCLHEAIILSLIINRQIITYKIFGKFSCPL